MPGRAAAHQFTMTLLLGTWPEALKLGYNPDTMRVLGFFLLIPALALAQSPQLTGPCTIPAEMQGMCGEAGGRGTGLNAADTTLLEAAVEPHIKELEALCKQELSLDSFVMASITLGKLGKGVIVSDNGNCNCGATGNCLMSLYVRDHDRFRQVPLGGRKGSTPSGFAFGTVNSESGIPDLIFAQNMGRGIDAYNFYRYAGDRFVRYRQCSPPEK
jgi:hypothetical protein